MLTKQEIPLQSLFKILFEKWWLLLFFILAGSGSAFLITSQLITPVYEATTVLYIGNEESLLANLQSSLNLLETNSRLILDYEQIALTRQIIDTVTENTYLEVTDNPALTNDEVIDYQTFRNNTVIEVVDNSRLFTIAFRNPSPQIAKQVADELANQLITTVPEIIGVNNIQIVDTALLPEKPVTPSLLYNAIIGGALALILAFFVIVLSYLRKDPISSEAELENLTGVSVLGRIPEFKAELRDQSTLSNPTSKVAECFQILSTNLSFAVKEPEVLLLTSAIRSEGKSTTISNLANTYARSQKRVLLIDADLRLARIAHIYDINKNHPGLTDLLVNDLTLSAVLYSVESYQKFDILSAGNQQVSPSELLNSDAFEKLINDFRKDYDLILIDTPPVLNLADTNIISKVADGLLLVIASDQTSKTMVVAAKNSIEKAGGNLRGIILTKVKSTSHAAYHYDPKYKD